MKLSITHTGSHAEAVITGEFTFVDNQEYKHVLALLENREVKSLTLNISQMVFIDSAGLGMLMLLRNAAQKKNMSITLRGACGQVEKVLKLSKFDELFSMAA